MEEDFGSQPVRLELTRDEVLLVLASLHQYVGQLRESHGEVEASAARVSRPIGTLIWRLEEADAWPRQVGRHSADAVQPGS